MTDNKALLARLQGVGLSSNEAIVYLKLLEGASTHLRLSRETGITRSKIYRLAESLERRGLVARHTDDTGRFVVAAGPENLAITLTAEEERIKKRLNVLKTLIPTLAQFQNNRTTWGFAVRTYEGPDGFRQMLWHELKTKGELLVLGGATIEELAPNPRWAERHRAMTIAAGYQIRELLNETHWDIAFTAQEAFSKIYVQRHIDPAVLILTNQTSIYNNTVSTYHWRNDQKIGFEVISQDYATMMRQVFEYYWQMASSQVA